MNWWTSSLQNFMIPVVNFHDLTVKSNTWKTVKFDICSAKQYIYNNLITMTIKIPNSLLCYRQFSIVWWIALPTTYHVGCNMFRDVCWMDLMSVASAVHHTALQRLQHLFCEEHSVGSVVDHTALQRWQHLFCEEHSIGSAVDHTALQRWQHLFCEEHSVGSAVAHTALQKWQHLFCDRKSTIFT